MRAAGIFAARIGSVFGRSWQCPDSGLKGTFRSGWLTDFQRAAHNATCRIPIPQETGRIRGAQDCIDERVTGRGKDDPSSAPGRPARLASDNEGSHQGNTFRRYGRRRRQPRGIASVRCWSDGDSVGACRSLSRSHPGSELSAAKRLRTSASDWIERPSGWDPLSMSDFGSHPPLQGAGRRWRSSRSSLAAYG